MEGDFRSTVLSPVYRQCQTVVHCQLSVLDRGLRNEPNYGDQGNGIAARSFQGVGYRGIDKGTMTSRSSPMIGA